MYVVICALFASKTFPSAQNKLLRRSQIKYTLIIQVTQLNVYHRYLEDNSLIFWICSHVRLAIRQHIDILWCASVIEIFSLVMIWQACNSNDYHSEAILSFRDREYVWVEYFSVDAILHVSYNKNKYNLSITMLSLGLKVKSVRELRYWWTASLL